MKEVIHSILCMLAALVGSTIAIAGLSAMGIGV